MSEDRRPAVKSADRVLDLLELLGEWGPGFAHGDLATRLGIPKGSLTQLLRNLIARGYVRHAAETRTYQLGPKLDALVRRKTQLQDLPSLAQPFLERITEITRESSFLNLLNGDEAQLAGRVIGPQTLVTIFTLGHLVPLHETAGSRAILAFLPDDMREDYLARMAPEPADALRARIDRIRRDILSISRDELVLGIVGIAVPVLSSAGYALGSIAVSLPSVRYDAAKQAEIAAALREHVAILGRQLADNAANEPNR